MTDSFMHYHQSALDNQREDNAIQDLQDAGIYPDPDTDIEVGDYVQTTEEYDSLGSISGEVIEDYGNKVVIIDEAALNHTNLLCLSLNFSTKFGMLVLI